MARPLAVSPAASYASFAVTSFLNFFVAQVMHCRRLSFLAPREPFRLKPFCHPFMIYGEKNFWILFILIIQPVFVLQLPLPFLFFQTLDIIGSHGNAVIVEMGKEGRERRGMEEGKGMEEGRGRRGREEGNWKGGGERGRERGCRAMCLD